MLFRSDFDHVGKDLSGRHSFVLLIGDVLTHGTVDVDKKILAPLWKSRLLHFRLLKLPFLSWKVLWIIRLELNPIHRSRAGKQIIAKSPMGGHLLTVDKSRTEEVDIVLRPVNYEDSLGNPVGFLLTADSISPGDGSASLSFDLFMEIPLDRITDLSVSVDDVLINGKQQAILTSGDLNSAEPIQLQINIHNNGGKATGPFGVKLYLGQLVIDEYRVSQGISGFGVEPVILNWENPSPGSSTLKIFVDFEQEVDELNSDRADNTLSLPIFVSEKTTTSSDNDEDEPLLIGPSSKIGRAHV